MANYLTPEQIQEYTVDTGIKKAAYSFKKSFLLSFMGGMFIALAAIGSLIATFAIDNVSLASLIAGVVFSAGLIMVVIAGGDLFTGNVLLITAVLNKKITLLNMFKNLVSTFIGNLFGGMFVVLLINFSGILSNSKGLLVQKLILKAAHKIEYPFVQALLLGILCNLLVALAVWMMYSAKDIAGKVLACVFPITLFIIGGYEHIVANMYYIPAGFLASMSTEYVKISGVTAEVLSKFTLGGVLHNFLPVAIGNLLGGLVIGGVYYLTYKNNDSLKQQIKNIKISA